MENSEFDEQDPKKRCLMNSLSPTMARNSSTSPHNNKTADAVVLQYQNQKLVQQLDLQKKQFHEFETKVKELKGKKSSYDDVLIVINQLWNQLVDDLVLLGVRAGTDAVSLHKLDHKNRDCGSYPAEEIFLCRLLEADSINIKGNEEISKFVESALALRQSSTMDLMKALEVTIAAQRTKTDRIAKSLHGKITPEDAVIQLTKIDDMMEEEAVILREAIDILHLKHTEYATRIQAYKSKDLVYQSEVKRLAGELEETMTDLEESRRKLINLQMQKDAASGLHNPPPCLINGDISPEKPTDKTSLRNLKDSVEEAKILAADRLSELEEAQQYNMVMSKQLQDLQNELKDDNHIHSSRLYNLANDQLQHWKVELDRYKALTDSLQADRSFIVRKEKELSAKADLADASKNTIGNSNLRIEELQQQLQRCLNEKNELQIRLEEVSQDSGRKDIKGEFRVMASALSKEMGMMEAQLNRWKEIAHEAFSLGEEAKSLKALLSNKESEQKFLQDKCAKEAEEIKCLNAVVEKLQKEQSELQIFLDMFGSENSENRDVTAIRESESRAQSQAFVLKNALEEHGLELRVKAAKEVEAACHLRLSAAEAEIAELRAKVDVTKRNVLELNEAIKIKEREAEAYISEIETIGQAYEDMQTQNQSLLQQVTERDDYNIKLVSESVKTKQAQSLLLSEKQTSAKQLQQVEASVDSLRARIANAEEQMKVCLTDALKSIQEDRHLSLGVEIIKRELADAEKESKWLKSAIASSEKDYEQIQRKRVDIQAELDSERSENKKLDEELMALNAELAELSSESGEAAVERLQDEIKNCKNILKCGVCLDRPKEVVILKCYHLFCNQCIQRNLELRHRKCPGCGAAFGQNDVRFVKI